MAGANNRELENFTHNLIRGDLCLVAVHSALGSGLSGSHKSCFCDRCVDPLRQCQCRSAALES